MFGSIRVANKANGSAQVRILGWTWQNRVRIGFDKFTRFAPPETRSWSTCNRKSRAHARFSIYSWRCPKTERLHGGANRI